MDKRALRAALDLRQNQAAKRDKLFGEFGLDEIRALKQLAYRIWGPMGVVETGPDTHGIVSMGYYIDPKERLLPSARRRRVLLVHGATYAEILAQCRALKLPGLPS